MDRKRSNHQETFTGESNLSYLLIKTPIYSSTSQGDFLVSFMLLQMVTILNLTIFFFVQFNKQYTCTCSADMITCIKLVIPYIINIKEAEDI